MSLGTLSESRSTIKPQAFQSKVANPPALESATATAPTDKPVKNTPPVITTAVQTTTAIAEDTGLVNKPTVAVNPTTTPTTIVMEQPTKKPCTYCTAKSITGIAFQISAVILLLALSFNLVKKV